MQNSGGHRPAWIPVDHNEMKTHSDVPELHGLVDAREFDVGEAWRTGVQTLSVHLVVQPLGNIVVFDAN